MLAKAGKLLAEKVRFSKPDLWVVLLLLILGFKLIQGHAGVLDIGEPDDSAYLYRGVKLASLGLPPPAWGPLYSIWFYFLSFLEANRVNLYFLNYALTTILPPVFAFLFLRRNKASIPFGLIFAWLLLVSRANVEAWPRVSNFALIGIFSSLMLVSRARSVFENCLLAAFGALFMMYIRPEYFLTYVLLLFFIVATFFVEREKLNRRLLMGFFLFGLFSAVMFFAFGSPVAGNRRWLAFGQHFSLNWVRWNGSDINPWHNWESIVSRNFGSARGVFEAIATNPSMFFRHIIFNMGTLIKELGQQICPINYPLSTGGIAWLLLSASVVYRANIRANFLRNKKLLAISSLFFLPTLISVILIYPRAHYLLLFWGPVFSIVAILLAPPSPLNEKTSFRKIFMLGALLVVMTPSCFSVKKDADRPNMEMLRILQQLEIRKPIGLLSGDVGYVSFLADNFRRVPHFYKQTSFKQFLEENKINIIVPSRDLLDDSRYKDDPEWQDFLTQYRQQGYVRKDIPRTDGYFFVRDSLLSN